MIDEEKNIIIIHPPRCGGTSLETALTGRDIWAEAPLEKHLNALEILGRLKEKNLDPDNFRWIGLKRNPEERVISMYHRAYWSDSWPFSLFKKKSFLKFAATVTPESHEHNNMSLSDFHNSGRRYEIIDTTEIDNFLNKEFNISNPKRLQNVRYNTIRLFSALV